MPRYLDEDDGEPDDDSGFQDDDISLEELAAQDLDAVIPCPHCGAEIHEEAQRCPSCATYISQEDAPPHRKPVWIIVGILLTLAIATMWALRG